MRCRQDTVRQVISFDAGKSPQTLLLQLLHVLVCHHSGNIYGRKPPAIVGWFRAITAIWKKPGLSIKELQRQIGITYKTALSINHRIRAAIRACNGNPEKLF